MNLPVAGSAGAVAPVEDRELLARLRRGDEVAFAGLSAACRIVIDTDRTDVPVMGL
jgi:hypothetical protein